MPSHHHEPGTPMPFAHARHLLNPLRALLLSPAALAKRLELQPGFKVLELGPGPGYYSPAIARAVPQGRLVLVDVQPEMLDMARRRLESQGVQNADYVVADALALPIDSDSMDVAFLVAVLGEIPDHAASLRELHRVLKPGGLLSITELPLFDPDSLSAEQLESLARAAGFRLGARQGSRASLTLGFEKAA